jgi:hypothetical protein
MHDRHLDSDFLGLQFFGQINRRKSFLQRLRPQMAEEAVLRQRICFRQLHQTKAARVVQDDAGAIIHQEDEVVVLARFIFCILVLNQQPPRHAQVQHQRLPVAEMHEHVFSAAVDRHDLAVRNPAQLWWKRNAQVGAVLRHGFDFAPRQNF